MVRSSLLFLFIELDAKALAQQVRVVGR